MPNPESENKTMNNRQVLAFALQFGFMIIIPLVILGLGGKWLSQEYNNQIFLYGGIVLAFIISVSWILKKIKDIYTDFIK